MATTYRYLFVDLLSNTIIGELPLTSVSFTQQLNQPGSFQGHLLLSGINADKYNVQLSTIPARCGLYVDRDGILVWGGVIWGRSYNSTSQTLTFNAQEWISYFEHRRVTQDVDFVEIDQLVIAKTLIEDAQNATYGDIGVGYNSAGQTSSGVLVDRTYYSYELKNVFQAIQDLSRQGDGFDFSIDVEYDAITDLPVKNFNTYFPRSGTAYSFGNANVPVFTFPAGNMVEYEYPEDGSVVANTVYALGAGSNEGKLISVGQDITKLTEGWALLETTSNYSDIIDETVLQELANAQSLATSYPPVVLKVVVPAYVDPVFGTYQLGDDARIIITDSRFPNTLDEIYRIVGLTVQPGENGPERVTLTLAQGAGEA
jgi:hypothetical protein